MSSVGMVVTLINDLKSLRMTLGWSDCTSSVETGEVDVEYFNFSLGNSEVKVVRDGYMLYYERVFPSGTGIVSDDILDYEFNCMTSKEATQQFKILQTYSPENIQLWFDTLHNAINRVLFN